MCHCLYRCLFLLPAACSLDIITAREPPTAADWLDGRDQEKVTGVKSTGITNATSARDVLQKKAFFVIKHYFRIKYTFYMRVRRCVAVLVCFHAAENYFAPKRG